MNALIQTVLNNRGYTRDYLMDINNHRHDDLIDIDSMCEQLKNINDNHKVVTVLPDFDTDGIMSGVVGFAGLAELGFRVNLFIPEPNEGYGFTVKTIDDLLCEYPDTEVILTCDVGITCYEGIDYAKSKGITVLVTDHHTQQAKNNADVTVNPKRMDETYEHPEICGAHVLYQVLEKYAQLYHNTFVEEQIRRLRVFAGIGTISDLMPVLYENRQLVRDSVNISRFIYGDGDDSMARYIPGCDIYRRAFYGLHIYYKTMADYGSIRRRKDIDEKFYAFTFAPMLNSVKRMDGDLSQAFSVFFGHDPKSACDYLFNLNNERKITVKNLIATIMEDEANGNQPYAPYVYISDSYPGLDGLLATQLMGLNGGLPCMCINKHPDGSFSGSGRSPEFYALLSRAVENGFKPAGHEHAFGIRFDDENEIKRFVDFLDNDIKAHIPETGVFERDLYDFVIGDDSDCDTEIDIELFMDYLDELEYYKPFGKSFPAPNLKLKFRKKDAFITTMGSTQQHFKAVLPYGFVVLSWNNAHYVDIIRNMNDDDIIEVCGGLSKNVYNDSVTIQFIADALIENGGDKA